MKVTRKSKTVKAKKRPTRKVAGAKKRAKKAGKKRAKKAAKKRGKAVKRPVKKAARKAVRKPAARKKRVSASIKQPALPAAPARDFDAELRTYWEERREEERAKIREEERAKLADREAKIAKREAVISDLDAKLEDYQKREKDLDQAAQKLQEAEEDRALAAKLRFEMAERFQLFEAAQRSADLKIEDAERREGLAAQSIRETEEQMRRWLAERALVPEDWVKIEKDRPSAEIAAIERAYPPGSQLPAHVEVNYLLAKAMVAKGVDAPTIEMFEQVAEQSGIDLKNVIAIFQYAPRVMGDTSNLTPTIGGSR